MIRTLTHLALALPAMLMASAWRSQSLGVDPQKALILETGIWTFNLLLVVLFLPVASRWARWPVLLKYRRAIGLWVFAYATTHFTMFLSFYLGWDFVRLAEEITDRPYVLLGFGAWLILAALASTSTRAAIKKLGRRWKHLHTFVYLALVCAVIHYLLMIRSDWSWPVAYAVIGVCLLMLRLRRSRGLRTRN